MTDDKDIKDKRDIQELKRLKAYVMKEGAANNMSDPEFAGLTKTWDFRHYDNYGMGVVNEFHFFTEVGRDHAESFVQGARA